MAKWPSTGNEHTARSIGYDPRYLPERKPSGMVKEGVYKKNPDGSRKTNPAYQPIAVDVGGGEFAFRRFDVSEEEYDKLRDTAISHSLYDASKAVSVACSGTLMSTEKRNRVGIMSPPNSGKGSSSAEDVQSGGSNEVYFYLEPSGSSGRNVVIDGRYLAYTCVRNSGLSGDPWGCKVDWSHGGSYLKHQAHSVQEDSLLTEALATGSTIEMVASDKVSILRWAKALHVGSARHVIIEKLKAAGITKMGPDNRPVEEVVLN
jgi:hypothetical protein